MCELTHVVCIFKIVMHSCCALFVFHRLPALRSIVETLALVLPIETAFLDSLAELDNIVLQGRMVIDLSIIASIPANAIGGSNYGDNITVNVVANSFESKASFGSDSFSMELPIALSDGFELFSFAMTDASFSRDIFVGTRGPVFDINQLLPHDQTNASLVLDYGGTFDANLPLTVGIAGVNTYVDLIINDPNIIQPNPTVTYAVDLCDVHAAMMDLFDQLKVLIVAAVRAPFGNRPVMFDIDRLTDPLIERLDIALDNFTEGMNVTFSSFDCSRRLGVVDTIQSAMSLVETLQEGLSYANGGLNTTGMFFTADITPYYNSQTFSVGVNVDLRAEIQQTATDVLGVVSDYIAFATDPSEESTDSKLGLGEGDAPIIDIYELASNTALAAGFDISFGIDLNMMNMAQSSSLLNGIALYVDTYGAFAEMIVDPIELSFSLFGKDVFIRDSHIATAADLRSRGRFFATIDDMVSGRIDITPLIPDLTVPLSAEVVIDVPVTDEIVMTPIMSAESDNLAGGDFEFYFDVDLDTFLNSQYMVRHILCCRT